MDCSPLPLGATHLHREGGFLSGGSGARCLAARVVEQQQQLVLLLQLLASRGAFRGPGGGGQRHVDTLRLRHRNEGHTYFVCKSHWFRVVASQQAQVASRGQSIKLVV